MSVEVPAVPLPSATVDSAPSRAAILGHPIHPMLVPLPIGLLVAATVSDLVGTSRGGRFWARASRLLLGGTVATGATAGAVGAIDFVSVEQARRPEGWIHATGNAVILLLTVANLGLRTDDDHIPVAGATMSVIATAILGLTGWMGGELSYRYRVGVTPRRHGEVIGTNEDAEAVPAP